MEIKLYGIRHHGPGSTKRLLKALEQFQPDILLVEGAEELTPLLPYVLDEGLEPPVAALIYNPKNLKEAVYYPFASFSPEWQSFRYAHQQGIPVRQMDLPQSLSFGLSQEPERLAALESQTKLDEDSQQLMRDPLGYLAQLAGYTDSERWWEVMFEQGLGAEELFETILEMMTALREEVGNHGQAMNRIREAYMRKVLRKAVKDGFERIAVVCGAWHTPVLKDLAAYKTKDDNALLKGIPKVKTKATWIPWTYQRIANSSGYGAGVVSPAWYELLYENRSDATILWMAKVAQCFKEEDLETSSAHAIEAVRLADTLATLRGLAVPGIEELREAVCTIFTGGDERPLELIKHRLVIGDEIGTVPDHIPTIPLQQDMDQLVKSLKLAKYKKTTEAVWLKATANKPQGGLDLRQEHDLKQSQFLHRLSLLGIEWGQLERGTGRELSTKNEYWRMEWRPEFALQIIEAGMWGNTVEEAASQWIIQESKNQLSLSSLTKLLDRVLHANLPKALDHLVEELRNIAAVTQDINHLMQALPALVQVQRYGDVRNTAVEMVNKLLQEMIPRICIGLPNSATSLDEKASHQVFEQTLAVNRALLLLDQVEYLDLWVQTLERLATQPIIDARIRGGAVRMLLDRELWGLEQVAEAMNFALSASVSIQEAVQWLEGFLHGSGLLLIHHASLWQLVDQWINGLNNDGFQQLLPALRRTFSSFAPTERKKMLQLVQRGRVEEKSLLMEALDQEKAKRMVPMLKQLLGESSTSKN